MSEEVEYFTLTEARKHLKVSEYKLNRLLYGDERRGIKPVLSSIPNPYHEGSRLIKKADLDAWLAQAPIRPRRRKNQEQELSQVAAA